MLNMPTFNMCARVCGRVNVVTTGSENTLWVSSTEPPVLRSVLTDRVTEQFPDFTVESSTFPETFGCDFVWTQPTPIGTSVDIVNGFVGVQRKTLKDLMSSMRDGRLQRGIPKMQELGRAVLLLEGPVEWTEENRLVGWERWTRSAYRNLMRSVQNAGLQITYSDNLLDTVTVLIEELTYDTKPHNSLLRRPDRHRAPTVTEINGESFGLHLLQSFPAIGPKLARTLVDHYGYVPLQWSVTIEELCAVPGIGKKTAQQLHDLLPTTYSDS